MPQRENTLHYNTLIYSAFKFSYFPLIFGICACSGHITNPKLFEFGDFIYQIPAIMKYQYVPQGVCSRLIEFEVQDGNVVDLKVMGGCHGNLQGISALVRGRQVSEVINLLSGIRCGHKLTSCPDQIASALRQATQH